MYRINEKCLKCHACIWRHLCPEEAIFNRNNVFIIDQDKCTGCGTCYASQEYICPVRAFVEKDTPA